MTPAPETTPLAEVERVDATIEVAASPASSTHACVSSGYRAAAVAAAARSNHRGDAP